PRGDPDDEQRRNEPRQPFEPLSRERPSVPDGCSAGAEPYPNPMQVSDDERAPSACLAERERARQGCDGSDRGVAWVTRGEEREGDAAGDENHQRPDGR